MTKDMGRLGLLISAFLTLLILGAAPAIAGATELVPPTNDTNHETSPPTTDNITTTDSVNPGGPNVTATDTAQTTTDTTTTTPKTQAKVDTLKLQGTSYLDKLRKQNNNPNHLTTAQQTANRQKRCQSLQTMLNKQISKFSQNAQTHLTTFNTVFTKVQAYATKNNVSTTTYTSLLATATADQSNATQAVDALKSVSVTFDCTQQDPASSLSTIKAAVDSARTSLQAYHKDLGAIISNLEISAKQ